jgi:hypothetical protein
MKNQLNPWMTLGLSLALSVLLALIVFPRLTYAGPELPTRDPPPTPAPPAPPTQPQREEDNDDGDNALPVAYIVLQGGATGWGVVQWQDSAAGWHDVEGWQGSVSTNRLWIVLPKDFGTGPFRWVVRQGADGPIVNESAPFNLPGRAGETVVVTVQ